MSSYIFFYTVVMLALIYAFWNGANDRANSIATIVKTRALSYKTAVILAGLLNFIGPFLNTAVALTIAKGIVPPQLITQPIVLGGLIGAVSWVWFATIKGIPVSITHSLIGGIAGAGIVTFGIDTLVWDKLTKIIIGIALVPLIGGVLGCLLLILCKWISLPFCVTSYGANRFWRWGQVCSSSWLSLSHGMNDGQNAIGIIALAYFSAGFSSEISITWWMIMLGGFSIGLGTAIAGWKVTHTVGWKITDLKPIDGFAAEIAGSAVITGSSLIGLPISTTHAAVTSILGVGGAKNLRTLNWKITNGIFVAWVLTIPAAALVGAVSHKIISLLIILN